MYCHPYVPTHILQQTHNYGRRKIEFLSRNYYSTYCNTDQVNVQKPVRTCLCMSEGACMYACVCEKERVIVCVVCVCVRMYTWKITSKRRTKDRPWQRKENVLLHSHS